MNIYVEPNLSISGYEFEQLCRIFYPERSILAKQGNLPQGEDGVQLALRENEITVRYVEQSQESTASADANGLEGKELELHFARLLYGLLCRCTGFTPPWGVLTGVRPIKLMRTLANENGLEYAQQQFRDRFLVSERKLELASRTFRHESAIIDSSRDNSFSLYIAIPFCPTRCDYCSFVSQSVEKSAKLLPQYVEFLVKEIYLTAQIARELGLSLETVYMGGGTPTTLSAQQMATVLGAVNDAFDLSGVREFTVEAGRPDTITQDKLEAIKSCGAQRISINPQTLSDEILERIGRRHTAAQYYEAMNLARKCGFTHINTDLIAGLEGDSCEGFAHSLDGVMSLSPEAITVHTLSMKRASNLVRGGEAEYSAFGSECVRMVEYSDSALTAGGYIPYYLYRQTRMVGNLENVGWSKPGHEGLYNIFIMDETHTILAVGASGVTKLRQPHTNNIERIFNYKFPYEYISRFDMLMERKKEIGEFYEKFC